LDEVKPSVVTVWPFVFSVPNVSVMFFTHTKADVSCQVPACINLVVGRLLLTVSIAWTVAEVEREEEGVLPIALAGDIDAYWADATPGVPEVGLRSALFQPTTGYSLPDAARMAEAVAAAPDLTSAAIRKMAETVSKTAWKRRSYYRLLNRMMFRACEPNQRYKVLERFYRLPQPLVERFYAGDATMGDKIRILTGKPPVPVSRAMRCLTEQSAFAVGARA